MKKLLILSTILLIIGVTVFVVYAYNRDTSMAMYEISTTYGSHYNSPDLLSLDRTGTDGDGPLYTTAHTWEGFTDDGYENTNDIWIDGGSAYFSFPVDTQSALDGLLDNGRFFEDNLVIEDPNDFEDLALQILTGGEIREYRSKNYDKKFAVSAWAYMSCGESYEKYETTYTLKVSVPEGFHIPHKRNPTGTEHGSFSDSEFMHGAKDGWDFNFDVATTTAYAKADGHHPSEDESHTSETQTPSTALAVHLYYYCGACGSYKKPNPEKIWTWGVLCVRTT